MITVDAALVHVLALAGPVRAETLPLGQACGRVLAAPAIAAMTQPPFDWRRWTAMPFAPPTPPRR